MASHLSRSSRSTRSPLESAVSPCVREMIDGSRVGVCALRKIERVGEGSNCMPCWNEFSSERGRPRTNQPWSSRPAFRQSREDARNLCRGEIISPPETAADGGSLEVT